MFMTVEIFTLMGCATDKFSYKLSLMDIGLNGSASFNYLFKSIMEMATLGSVAHDHASSSEDFLEAYRDAKKDIAKLSKKRLLRLLYLLEKKAAESEEATTAADL
ncbi:hypothetical protein ACH5RR_039903 [Cinchona calisaya]|uniref:Uncharacterized protein n=1 Tax=Cinchona calisaya TaxID=153742 RepID=A0ABD2Y250_9GENT